jgi:hypothetical protein
MSKLELMEEFMNTFVGNGLRLVIREQGNSFWVHTIKIFQKEDERCPVRDTPVGDYFLNLIATNQHDKEASILCNWSQELLANLLKSSGIAKDAGLTHVVMFRDPKASDPNRWMLACGGREHPTHTQTKHIAYIS